jgi:hypothetical protein
MRWRFAANSIVFRQGFGKMCREKRRPARDESRRAKKRGGPLWGHREKAPDVGM